MKRRIRTIWPLAVLMTVVVALVALTVGPAGASPATSPDGVELKVYGDGTAVWSSAKSHGGNYSVLLKAGTAGGANAGRIQMAVEAIPIAEFTGASYYVWEPTGTQHGGVYPPDGACPYGDPYINIRLDLDGDGSFDDTLEGLGSIRVGDPKQPALHPTPALENWVEMEEGYGFYDMDDSMGQGTWVAWPIVVGTLDEWKTWLATNYPAAQVVGVQVTFGFWVADVTPGVYVDDITVNGVTYDLETSPLIIDSPTAAAPAYISPPGYVSVSYTVVAGAGAPDAAVDIEVFKELTVIGTKTTSVGNLVDGESVQNTASVYITAAAVDGSYDVSVAVDDGVTTVSATKVDAVTVTSANPTVTITVGEDMEMINEDLVGTGMFDVIATFDKPMDTGYAPNITFIPDITAGDAAATLPDDPSDAWSDGDTVYTATYNVADGDVEIADVDVIVGGAKDKAGVLQDPNPTTAADLFSVDTINPTLDSIAWTDADDSRGINAGDTLLFTFSEAMDPDTVIDEDGDPVLNTALPLTGGTTYGEGATVDWGTPTTLTVTLGSEVDIDSGATVNPTSVTDVAGNGAQNGDPTPAIVDEVGPKLVSITWWDMDASGTINAGADPDTLVFRFSENMDETTVTASTLAARLVLSGGTYGTTGATVDWGEPEGANSFTVILGTGASIIPTVDTVTPADTVKDAAGNADDTLLPVGIVQGVIVSFEAPATVLPGDAVDVPITITHVTNIDAGNFQVMFDFAVLQLDGVTAGEIGGTEIPAIHQPIVDTMDDMVIVTGATIVVNVPDAGGSPIGATGEGTLAVLNFTFIGVSGEESDLTLVEGTLSNKDALAINAKWVDPESATVAATLVVGDANGNGILNVLDITRVEKDIAWDRGIWTSTLQRLLGFEANPGADANVDSTINALDITRIEHLVAGGS